MGGCGLGERGVGVLGFGADEEDLVDGVGCAGIGEFGDFVADHGVEGFGGVAEFAHVAEDENAAAVAAGGGTGDEGLKDACGGNDGTGICVISVVDEGDGAGGLAEGVDVQAHVDRLGGLEEFDGGVREDTGPVGDQECGEGVIGVVAA